MPSYQSERHLEARALPSSGIFGRKQMNLKLFPERIERGFTLLEIMIVLVVATVLAGFAIPKYLTIRASLRTTGDDLSLADFTGQANLRAASDCTHPTVY